MDLLQRAQNAFERGDRVRAVVMLAERLKRAPGEERLVEPMARLYVEGIETPGLERDVVTSIAGVEGGARVAADIVASLREEGRKKMAADFERVADDVGLELASESATREPVEVGVEARRQAGGRENTAGGGSEQSQSAGDLASHSPAPADDGPASHEVVEPSTNRSEAPREEQPEGDGAYRDDDASARREHLVGGDEEHSAGCVDVDESPPEEPADPDEGGEEALERGPAEESQAALQPSGGDEETGTFWEGWVAQSRVRRGAGLAVAVAFLVGGYIAWGIVSPSSVEAQLEGELERLDATTPEPFYESYRETRRMLGDGPRVRERRWFADAVAALRAGGEVEFDGEPETAWGRAARAGAALSRDDLESAVRFHRELERRRASERLPRMWAAARVAEARGKLARARRRYREGLVAFSEFEPFLSGLVRTSAASLAPSAFDEAIDRLAERIPDHPYTTVEDFPFPNLWEHREIERRDSSREPATVWNRDVRRYRRALRRAHRGNCNGADDMAGSVLESWVAAGPARWIRAVCSAARFRVERADEAFGRLVESDAVAEPYRLRLQATAPAVLTGAGRPDLGAKYLLAGTEAVRVPANPELDKEGDAEASTTIVTRTDRWADELERSEVDPDWLARAELARIETLAELGALERASRHLQEASSPESFEIERQFAAAELEVRRGERPAGVTSWARRRANRVERLVTSFYADSPSEAADRARDFKTDTERLIRYRVLSVAASGRVRRARALLDERGIPPVLQPARARLRARIEARLAGRSRDVPDGCRRLVESTPTSGEAAVDAAACLLWSGEVREANRWARRARRCHPESPATNWIRGVALRALGERERAEEYLARFWRSKRGDARLDLELGIVNVALGNWERARDLFREALYKEPGSVRAIRRLGRTYLRIDPDEGRWNFERLLESYQKRDGRRLQAAEVHRWLAIFEGSRDGEGGFDHLRRAADLVGQRRSVLVEMGRYREARGEWARAESKYLDVLERDSTSEEAHLGLARVADELDETQTMRVHLREYLDLRPRGGRAEWARSRLEAAEKISSNPSSE